MPDAAQQALDLYENALCNSCAWARECGLAHTDAACQSKWGRPETGGLNVHHVLNPDTGLHMADVGGPGFNDVVAQPIGRLALPPLLELIRPKSQFAGQLQDSVYAVGPKALFGRGNFLRSADDIREHLDMWANQQLILILFGSDPVLERIWARQAEIIRHLASAGFARVIPPSFSAYRGRPPSEFMLHAKRSLWFFGQLQAAGVASVPQLVWLRAHEMRRAAAWCRLNPVVQSVALDLGTIESPIEWTIQMQLLEDFDRRTGRRLSYLIHGPATAGRVEQLYQRLDLDRVVLSSSRACARPAGRGSTFDERATPERVAVADARARTRAAAPSKPLRLGHLDRRESAGSLAHWREAADAA